VQPKQRFLKPDFAKIRKIKIKGKNEYWFAIFSFPEKKKKKHQIFEKKCELFLLHLESGH
jgi:hypothetical protein